MRDTHARLAGEAGRADPDHDGCALGRSARLRGARRRAGAARMAHEGADPEHALLARDREARGSELVSRRRRARASTGSRRTSSASRELPVLAQVEPGDIRAALPASPPDEPEPFSAVLADLDSVLMPGLTHWQSPRFFAYFATTGSEPGVLAELLIAGLNQVGILWRTSPALQELEELTRRLAAAAASAFRPSFAATSRTRRRRAVLAAVIAARGRSGRTGVSSSCSEHAHSVGEKAARAARPRAAEGSDRRRVPDASRAARASTTRARSSRRSGRRAWRRSIPSPEIADACAAAGTWLHVDAAYAGSAAILPRAAPPLRRLGARGLDRREPAQVARRPDGLLGALDAPPRGVPQRVQPRPGVPALARRRA